MVVIEAKRNSYSQGMTTMTVGELIDCLSQFPADEKVILSFDNGYTYGGFSKEKFSTKEE